MSDNNGVLRKGVYPMLVTPFSKDGGVNLRDLDALTDHVLESEAPGLSLLGLAGESAQLDIAERKLVTEQVLARVAARKPVIVGTSARTVPDAVDLAGHAHAAGAAALMVAPPAAGSDGAGDVDGYFEAVLQAAGDTAVMIQDAPTYVGTSLRPAFARDLAERHGNVRYVKAEGFPVVEHVAATVESARALGLHVFGGNGGVHYIDALNAGAFGMIPGCECIAEHLAIFAAFDEGRHEDAQKLYRRMMPLFVYQMQSLEFFIACNKLVLVNQGVLTEPALRSKYRMTPRALDLLNAYFEESTGARDMDA